MPIKDLKNSKEVRRILALGDLGEGQVEADEKEKEKDGKN